MTFSQVEELFDYWQESPPAHELIAARYGHKSSAATGGQQIATVEDLDSLIQMNKATGGRIEGMAPG